MVYNSKTEVENFIVSHIVKRICHSEKSVVQKIGPVLTTIQRTCID